MEESRPLNKNEIDEEKQKLQQEINRLDIYKNCNDYELDQLLYYFPNRATEITDCFYKEEGKNVLQPDKKGQLQKIIMNEFCSLFEPYIHTGYQVLQLNESVYRGDNCKYLICLKAPENYKHIGISIGKISKTVSTNAIFDNDDKEPSKRRFFPISGIQINDSKFHNEIKIFDHNNNHNYRLIIYPDTNTIKLTDSDKEETEYATFRDQNNEIFQNKEDIKHFFSTLSFTEIEQVLQVLDEHLKDKNYYEVNIRTVLKEIKDTIESKRNERNSINENEGENSNETNKESQNNNDNNLNNKYLNSKIDINQNASEKEDKREDEKRIKNNSSRYHLCEGMCYNSCIGYDKDDNWHCFT